MGDETLSTQELDALLEGADIIYDDTKKYIKEPSSSTEVKEGQDAKLPYEKSTDDFLDDIDIKDLSGEQKRNTDLLLDIYVKVTVELGRTSIKVKDVLALGEGSIIELGKPASEPVDLLVNNRLIAHGEVVVIDENFGTRVTNIVSLPKKK